MLLFHIISPIDIYRFCLKKMNLFVGLMIELEAILTEVGSASSLLPKDRRICCKVGFVLLTNQ